MFKNVLKIANIRKEICSLKVLYKWRKNPRFLYRKVNIMENITKIELK